MADDGAIGVDGTIEWRDAEGRLDRADGPAVVHVNGSVKYYRDGRRVWLTEGRKVREERGGRHSSSSHSRTRVSPPRTTG